MTNHLRVQSTALQLYSLSWRWLQRSTFRTKAGPKAILDRLLLWRTLSYEMPRVNTDLTKSQIWATCFYTQPIVSNSFGAEKTLRILCLTLFAMSGNGNEIMIMLWQYDNHYITIWHLSYVWCCNDIVKESKF